MKRFTTVLKILFLSLVVIGAMTLCWEFMIPGMLLWWIFRERYRPWMGSVAALVVVLGFRFYTGHWTSRIGGNFPDLWFVEIMSGIVSWAIGSIFITTGRQIFLRYFEGLNPRTP